MEATLSRGVSRLRDALLGLGADADTCAAIVQEVLERQTPQFLAALDAMGPDREAWFQRAAEGLLRCHATGTPHA